MITHLTSRRPTTGTLPMRRSARRGAARASAALVAATVLLACGDGNGDDDDAAEAAAAVEADASAADGTAEETEGTADGEGAEAAPAPSGPASAEDGWNGSHDLDTVGPGQGILRVAGEEIDLEVTCTTPGPLDDHELFLFAFDARGDGVDSQGRDVYVEVKRRITREPESFYDYAGHETGTVQTVVALGGEPAQFHSAIEVSPSDSDSAGERLPLVRVDEDGTFTVVDDIPAMPMHEEALAGPTELVGSCHDGWPQDATGGVPLF